MAIFLLGLFSIFNNNISEFFICNIVNKKGDYACGKRQVRGSGGQAR